MLHIKLPCIIVCNLFYFVLFCMFSLQIEFCHILLHLCHTPTVCHDKVSDSTQNSVSDNACIAYIMYAALNVPKPLIILNLQKLIPSLSNDKVKRPN